MAINTILKNGQSKNIGHINVKHAGVINMEVNVGTSDTLRFGLVFYQ